jgi:hypothetical protein
VIRQAISCDICGAEKKQTNHWFVAFEQGGELRVCGWSSRNRLRPGSRHLCGQTCLHKLVDEFMARTLTGRPAQNAASEVAGEIEAEVKEAAAKTDASLTTGAAYKEFESSARLIATPTPALPAALIVPATTNTPASPLRQPLWMPMELVVMPVKPRAEEGLVPVDEPPRYATRNWRAAAWEREREREMHTGKVPAGITARRRVGT